MESQYIEEVLVKSESNDQIIHELFQQDISQPRLVITEQPASSVRFRYPSEGNSHGGIPGIQSTEFRKTCPTVEITDYKGYAKIVVQIVTDDFEPKMHVHSLVGKQCTNGVCSVVCGPGEMRAQFPNLGIQHVKKKDAEKLLMNRYSEIQDCSGQSPKALRDRAKGEVEKMNLSAVRLMFIAYLPDESGNFIHQLDPVISNTIVDNKSTLKICRISRVDSPATGGAEIYLLCDKVQKEDIQVRLFELDAGNNEIWEDYCRFAPTDVHRQYAIVMKTPPYKNENIERPVKVHIQLRRKSDGQCSQAKSFTYTPPIILDGLDQPKRKRMCQPAGRPQNISTVGGMGNQTFRPLVARNGRLKVEQHDRPVDPSILMKRSSFSSQGSQMRNSPYSPPLRSTGNANMVATSSPQQYQTLQSYGSPQMNGMNNNAMSPQNVGVVNQNQNIKSPIQQVSMASSGGFSPVYSSSVYSNPGSATSDYSSSHGSPLGQQYSPAGQQVPSPASSTTSMASTPYENVPCIPGTNIPNPDDLDAVLQQTSHVQTSLGNNVYTPMQNVQSQSNQVVNNFNITAQDVDRQAFGSDLGNVMDQLDFDNAEGKVPSIGSQFVQGLLGYTIKPFNAPSGDCLVQADSSAIQETKPGQTESDSTDDFASGMQEVDEDHETRAIDVGFVEELLPNVVAKVRECLTSNSGVASLAQAKKMLTNVHDSSGNTCLHLAALNGHTNILTQLAKLSSYVDHDKMLLNIHNDAHQTPLHLAVLKKDLEAVKCLVAAGANPVNADGNGNTAIHLACATCQPEALESMLTVVPSSAELYNYEGLTPLHKLVGNKSDNCCKCLKALLSKGVDVNEQDLKSGRTALHMAIEDQNLSAATYLVVKCDADVDAVTYDGLTPLHIAAAHNQPAIVKMLLAFDADKEAYYCEEEDSTPLSLAAFDAYEVKKILTEDDIPLSMKEEIMNVMDSKAGHGQLLNILCKQSDNCHAEETLVNKMDSLVLAGSSHSSY